MAELTTRFSQLSHGSLSIFVTAPQILSNIYITSLHKKPLIFFPFFRSIMKKGKKMMIGLLPLRRPIIKRIFKGHDSTRRVLGSQARAGVTFVLRHLMILWPSGFTFISWLKHVGFIRLFLMRHAWVRGKKCVCFFCGKEVKEWRIHFGGNGPCPVREKVRYVRFRYPGLWRKHGRSNSANLNGLNRPTR